jgi:hypothetical protein
LEEFLDTKKQLESNIGKEMLQRWETMLALTSVLAMTVTVTKNSDGDAQSDSDSSETGTEYSKIMPDEYSDMEIAQPL